MRNNIREYLFKLSLYIFKCYGFKVVANNSGEDQSFQIYKPIYEPKPAKLTKEEQKLVDRVLERLAEKDKKRLTEQIYGPDLLEWSDGSDASNTITAKENYTGFNVKH